jgi:hypothetical protein
MTDSKRFYSLARWFFWITVIVSGIAGIKITRMFSYHLLMAVPFLSYCWPLSLVVLQMVFACIIFVVVYRVVALNLVTAIESKRGVEIYRPSVARGMIFSALIPFILGILTLVLIFLIAHSGMHDSM